jgi:glycosyltransferase involved in cell wall biosynthesis
MKIAVFLVGQHKLGGGMGRTAVMLCDALLKCDRSACVVLGSALSLEEVRPLIDPRTVDRMDAFGLTWASATGPDGVTWIRPRSPDGYDFLDCDAWIFWHMPAEGVVAPLRPYAVFCADLLVRIVPLALSQSAQSDPVWNGVADLLQSYRNATLVFCTTPRTFEDVVGFAGVPRSRVSLAPQFAPSTGEAADRAASVAPFERYILWTTNDTPHKNHRRAFEMLDIYYSQYPDEALPVVVTGPGTQYFSPAMESHHYYHREIAEWIAGRENLARNVFFAGVLDRADFIGTLRRAAFLWHNVIYDNGTASVFEAAEYGVPSLVTDYPQMRFFDEKYRTKARFFSAFDVEAGARALIDMTRDVKTGHAEAIGIDYAEENAKFYRWLRRFMRYMKRQKANHVMREAAADARFNASSAAVALAANAAGVWPKLRSYVASFPWSDVPVAALLVFDPAPEVLARLIDSFEAALRQHYVNFKLLIALPDDGEALENLRLILLNRVLAFDFLLAGTLANRSELETLGALSRCLFTVGESAVAVGLPGSPPIRLDGGATADALAPVIARALKAAGPQSIRHADLPARFWIARRRKAVDPVIVPAIDLPPSFLDFAQESFSDSLVSGFHAWEGCFRWVCKDAIALVGGHEEAQPTFHRKRRSRDPLPPRYRSFLIRLDVEPPIEGRQPPQNLSLIINDHFIGTSPISPGTKDYLFEVPEKTVMTQRLNRIHFSADAEYKAGGIDSPDMRQISWRAIGFGFVDNTSLDPSASAFPQRIPFVCR